MKKIVLMAVFLLSCPLQVFADSWIRVNSCNVETAYMYTVETKGMGTYYEIQATNGNPEVRDGLDAVWHKNPYIICAGNGGEGTISFDRVTLANIKKDSSGRYIPKFLPEANIVYQYTILENGNIKVYPVFSGGQYWPAAVDLTGEYYNVSAMTFASENLLLSFLQNMYPRLTKNMFADRSNKVESKALTEAASRKDYPGIPENLNNTFSIKVTDKAGTTVEFVGERSLSWIYRLESDGSAYPIHNKNGLG
ncbi:MAG: hypothetical protein Q4D07_03465 [Selenomonadaceae bacterium]|nr:hypothetical protein [Selenomonadaceae bacterium]